jgi:hypothetical protein
VIGFDTQNDGNDVNDRAIIDGRVTGANAFRQPSFFDLDLRLVKGFRSPRPAGSTSSPSCSTRRGAPTRTSGRRGQQLRHTQAPVATAGQPLFAPTTARYGGPRQLQLGARVIF